MADVPTFDEFAKAQTVNAGSIPTFEEFSNENKSPVAQPRFKRQGMQPQRNEPPASPLNDNSVVMNTLGAPILGAQQIGQGMGKMGFSGQHPLGWSPDESNNYTGGAADVLEGAGRVGSAFLPQALASAPIRTGVGLGAGILGQWGAGKAADSMGADADTSRLAGDIGGLGAGALTSWLGSSPTLRSMAERMVANKNNPVQESALNWAENRGVPMSVGQRAGRSGLQRLEQGMENVPGASGVAEDFYKNQQNALASTGRDVAQQISPVSTNDYGAGSAVNARGEQFIGRLKGQADNLYDQVRTAAKANQQTVQVGTTQSPGPNPAATLTPAGQPVTTPVMKTLESPVDLAPIQSQLTPLWNDINRLMPEAKKASSPAYAALRDLMTTKDQQMNAMDFDKYLGAVKALSRDGNSPYLTNQSQALARKIIQSGEQELSTALTPQLYQTLNSARNIVKAYYNAADLFEDLNNTQREPGALFKNLTSGGDRVVNALTQLKKIAPKEMAIVGRTFMEDLLNTATNQGGIARVPGIMQAWNRLGPETKSLLFGKQAPEIDQFMLAAKTLTSNLNPSGSAKMYAALSAMGTGGLALWSAIQGNPMPAAGFAAGVTGARMAANALFGGGARAVSSALPGMLPLAIGGSSINITNTLNGPQLPDQVTPQSLTPQFQRGGIVGATGKYDTPLSPQEEVQFQAWKTKNAPNDSGEDYDLRGAFKADLSGQLERDDRGHTTDKFKKPNHPTFSDQSMYHDRDGNQGGQWIQSGNTTMFNPSQTNLRYHSVPKLQQYFQEEEPGAILMVPPAKMAIPPGLAGPPQITPRSLVAR